MNVQNLILYFKRKKELVFFSLHSNRVQIMLYQLFDKYTVCIVQEYFEDMIKFMTSGPSHVLVLTKGETGENIIHEFRDLLGPPSVEEAREIAPDRSLFS